MLVAFVCSCMLLDCESLIHVDFILLFVIRVEFILLFVIHVDFILLFVIHVDYILLFVIHVWHPRFPLNGIKKYVTA